MSSDRINEQDQASMAGPRDMKEPGEPAWCWQTISALQSMWATLDIDFNRYMRTWIEAEEHRVWEKVPYDNPYGTKQAMLDALSIGDDAAARAKVTVQSMPSRPLNRITARIARDHPEVWERMKLGEFKSIAAAAREAGIYSRKKERRIAVSDDKEKLAHTLLDIYGQEGFKELAAIATRLATESSES